MERRSATTVALLLLLLAALCVDHRLSYAMTTLPWFWGTQTLRDLTNWGKAEIYISAFAVLWLINSYRGHAKWSEFFFKGLFALLVTGLLTTLLKSLIGRPRPDVVAKFVNPEFQPFSLDHLYQSFPSGHTQVVFTFAIFTSMRFPRLRLPAFFFAALIASTRIFRNAHFCSDVVGGILVAYLGLQLSDWLYRSARSMSGGKATSF